jgi:biopolymer transport protein ExbD
MRGASDPSIRAEPNVTPMIDVMLVLLIIFMVVTPMLLNPVRATPPDAAHLRAHPESPGDHTLNIDIYGGLSIDRKPVTRAELGARLDSIYANADEHVLFLRADRALSYSVVLEAMNTAREHGVRVVGLVARPLPEPHPGPSPLYPVP